MFPNKTSCIESISVVDTIDDVDVTRNRDVSLDCAYSAEKVYCNHHAEKQPTTVVNGTTVQRNPKPTLNSWIVRTAPLRWFSVSPVVSPMFQPPITSKTSPSVSHVARSDTASGPDRRTLLHDLLIGSNRCSRDSAGCDDAVRLPGDRYIFSFAVDT